MQRTSTPGKVAALLRLVMLFILGAALGFVGCQRPQQPAQAASDRAAPQVAQPGPATAAEDDPALTSSPESTSEATLSPLAAQPDLQAGDSSKETLASPAVPSGWIIPDDQPGSVPAKTARSGPADDPTPAVQASVEPSAHKPMPPGDAPAPQAVVSSVPGGSPPDLMAGPLPNPLRGGQRPSGDYGTGQGIAPSEPTATSSPPIGTSAPTTPPAQQTSGGSKVRRLERPPYDPIKENGQYFVGWTKPQVALVFTGRQDGYFEPCGCAGKDRMKGGLSRRHTMIRQLREQGWPVVVLDIGGLIKGFGKQTEVKFQVTVDALRTIGYDAINLGRNDLRLPAPLLLSVVAPAGQESSEFVSANVALFDFASDQWTSRYRIIEAGGKRVGVTAILGKSYQEEIRNPDLAFADPAEALAKVVPVLKQQADILVLLAYATDEEAFALVRQFPEFTVLATSDGPAEPPGSPRYVPDTQTLLVHVGEKGMAAVVLGFYDNPDQPVAYQRVILDSRYPDSPEMYQMMVNYQNQLEALGLEGLEIRPVVHPRREIQGEFVGSEKCANCHEKSYMIWKKSGHAKAWETLVRLDPPRTFDPECISCHVTGWHPTRYFPYQSGFLSEKETPQLIDVGCESCHGPGGEHVAAEMGSDIERQMRAAKAMVVTKEEAEHSEVHNCRNCHDLDNSPDFDFAKYWPLVEHYEKE